MLCTTSDVGVRYALGRWDLGAEIGHKHIRRRRIRVRLQRDLHLHLRCRSIDLRSRLGGARRCPERQTRNTMPMPRMHAHSHPGCCIAETRSIARENHSGQLGPLCVLEGQEPRPGPPARALSLLTLCTMADTAMPDERLANFNVGTNYTIVDVIGTCSSR